MNKEKVLRHGYVTALAGRSRLKALFVFLTGLIVIMAVSGRANAYCYDSKKVYEAMTNDTHSRTPIVVAHRGLWREGDPLKRGVENSIEALVAADRACIE